MLHATWRAVRVMQLVGCIGLPSGSLTALTEHAESQVSDGMAFMLLANGHSLVGPASWHIAFSLADQRRGLVRLKGCCKTCVLLMQVGPGHLFSTVNRCIATLSGSYLINFMFLMPATAMQVHS